MVIGYYDAADFALLTLQRTGNCNHQKNLPFTDSQSPSAFILLIYCSLIKFNIELPIYVHNKITPVCLAGQV